MNDDTEFLSDISPELSAAELQEKLNLETARISWSELEKHFARGVLITIAGELDLVAIALHFAEDDKAAIEPLLADNKISRTTDEQAQQWSEGDPDLWAVVVAPWILVQEK